MAEGYKRNKYLSCNDLAYMAGVRPRAPALLADEDKQSTTIMTSRRGVLNTPNSGARLTRKSILSNKQGIITKEFPHFFI